MKLFGPKSLSTYLFYVSRLTVIGTILFLLFILISFLTGNYEISGNQFRIEIPFTETYIKGVYKHNVITVIPLVLTFFIVFFYMLSTILKTFKAQKLFTKKAIKQLHYFGVLNLAAAPLLFIIIDLYIMEKPSIGNVHNLILSALLGVFVLFIGAIFKHGYHVQSENDLTI